jgi:hypothetical protein
MTAIIVFCEEEILILAIPPLSPQPSDIPPGLPDFNNPIHIPPLFKIPFPNGIVLRTRDILEWIPLSPWYYGCWESIYFGILFSNSKLQKFKLIIKPDLSDASLYFINTSEIILDGLISSLDGYRCCDGFRICEDALVYFWNNRKTWGTYTGSTRTSAPFTNVVTQWVQEVQDEHINSLCPTSGRYVYCTNDGDTCINRLINVVDLF